MTDVTDLPPPPAGQISNIIIPAVLPGDTSTDTPAASYGLTPEQLGAFAPPSTVPGPAPQITAVAQTGETVDAVVTGTSPDLTLTLTIPPGATGATPVIQALAQAGTTANVVVTGTPENPTLTFTLPQGTPGTPGAMGPVGPIAPVGTLSGSWNATTGVATTATGTVTLTANGGGGTQGQGYVVSVPGTLSIDGNSTWNIGDAIYNTGTKWIRVPNTGTAGAFSQITVGSNLGIVDNGDGQGYIAIVDQFGNILLRINGTATQLNNLIAQSISVQNLSGLQSLNLTDGSGNGILGANSATGVATLPGFTVQSSPGSPYAFAIVDELGQILFGITTAGQVVFAGSGSTTTSYSTDEINFRDARNLAYSAKVRSNYDTVSARMVYGFNHVLGYGQSLSSGWEGWPALTLTPLTDALMIGEAVRPAGESATTWSAVGSNTLSPLVATNQAVSATSGALLTPAQVAALSPGDFTMGETVFDGGMHMFRKLQLQMRGLLADPTRQLVVSSCGVGGQSIEQLSKGATPNLYNRLLTCATIAKGIATQAGQTYGISAIVFMQGENNYVPPSGSTSDGPTYLGLMQTLVANMRGDLASPSGVSGQADPPAVYIYQTHTSTDTDAMGIGMAQFQAAVPGPWGKQAIPSCYLFAPDYPVTNKDVHDDPNGYRWQSQQLAKVKHRVQTMGEGWYPLHPTQITYRGTQVLIDFHVPEPPLVFDMPWSGNENISLQQISVANQGFAVADSTGTISILSVTLASDTSVLIQLSRAPVGPVTVKYADFNDAGGRGGLRDSDPTVAAFDYEYNAGTGQYAVANQPTLNNLPYPLWNWCVAFWLAATPD